MHDLIIKVWKTYLSLLSSDTHSHPICWFV